MSGNTIHIGKSLLGGAIVVLLSAVAWSQAQKAFPGPAIDQRTHRTMDKVEEIYESGDFDRAMLIYRKELAPLGDKYAQYMVGYMYLTGQSVPEDRAEALAWFRLAAERGDSSFAQARDELYQGMSTTEIEVSTRIFVNIWQEYGDNRLLLDLIQSDMDTLRQQTGTRVAGSDRNLTVINIRSEQGGADFYGQIEKRIELRLNYLETSVEITDIGIAEDAADIQSMEDAIRKEFARLQSP